MVPTGPDVVDHNVPGQPEQPAPEWDAPRFVSRDRLQGLDEDELRQVLRVARAADAGGDVTVDRPVVVVEQQSECLRITGPSRFHEALNRLVVDRHNDPPTPVLGPDDYVAVLAGSGTSTRSPPRRNASASNPAPVA